MVENRQVDVRWPLRGENRNGGYAQEGGRDAVFTTPGTVNCRPRGPLERRVRGGSRPCLTKLVANCFGTNITAIHKLSYVDASDNIRKNLIVIADGNFSVIEDGAVTAAKSYLTINGDKITINGDYIIWKSTAAATNPIGPTNAFDVWEHGGRLYMASTALTAYDGRTEALVTFPNAPASQPMVMFCWDRCILFGLDHLIHMARQGNPNDWTRVSGKNVGRPLTGFVGENGVVGGVTTCGLVWDDTIAIFGTKDDLWAFYGNPGKPGSSKDNVSHKVGPISKKAAVITDDGLLVFLSKEGLYTWQIGSKKVERFSKVRVPEEMRNVDVTATIPLMEYDHKANGVHLYLTPIGATAGSHWFLDLEFNGLWPVKFGDNDHQPVVTCDYASEEDSDILLAGKDGYIRHYNNASLNDDSTAMNSDLMFGPIHMADYRKMGQLIEMVSDLADNTVGVTWRVYVGQTAEEVQGLAIADLDAGTTVDQDTSGAWGELHNEPEYPRSRGAFVIIWIDAASRWAFESLTAVIRELGRLR